MLPTLAQVSTLPARFEDDVRDYSASGVTAIEVWWGKLDQFLDSHSLDEARALCEASGIQTPVASFVGGLLAEPSVKLDAANDLLVQRFEQAQALQIQTLVLSEEIPLPKNQLALDQLHERLHTLADQAGQHGLRFALEFQSRSPFCNNLRTALAIVETAKHPSLGVCLDAFHFFMGASDETDLAFLSPANLFHVQLCDVLGTLREFARDAGRILPNEGDFSIDGILAHLQRINYKGSVSIELMNPHIYHIPPISFAEAAMASFKHILGE